MKNEILYPVRVISGKYKGREGKATAVNEIGNVMFYSKEGCYPYRAVLKVIEIEYL